jgi:hypothetical protein
MLASTTSPLSKIIALLLAWTLTAASVATESFASPAQGSTSAQAGAPSAERLEQLLAPIALYPDALVAQILAGATFPTQIVEADRWMQQNSSLQGDALAQAVDKQPWDESVKALTQFPAVLANMSKNLSWTSALGDAYFNDPAGVTATVQKLRLQAKNAGNLKTTKEQTVTTQGQTIIIQPANPQVVYVPTYNPTVVYGAPVAVYPSYSSADLAAAAIISFGIGMAVGAAINGGGCCGWGWNSWGYRWYGGGTVTYNRNVYVSHSNVYVNRNSYYHNPNNYPRPTPYGGNSNVNRSGNTINGGGGNTINRGGNTVNVNPGGKTPTTLPANRGNAQASQLPANSNRGNAQASQLPANANRGSAQAGQGQANANRGYGQARDPGTRSNAFSGYTAGGNAAAQQSRGQSSLGGGGGNRSTGAAGGKRR